MDFRRMLVTSLVPVSKDSLWLSCPGIAFPMSGKILCHSNTHSSLLYYWKLMTRQLAVTGEMGGMGDASLSSCTYSGKGKLMGFAYLFVDVKNYSGAPAKSKAQPQSFACRRWVKGFGSLSHNQHFCSLFYFEAEQKMPEFHHWTWCGETQKW